MGFVGMVFLRVFEILGERGSGCWELMAGVRYFCEKILDKSKIRKVHTNKLC